MSSIAADYQLIWPRRLFQTETAALINNTRINDWADRCELLLEDAFLGVAPRDDFMAEPGQGHDFLIKLLRRAETLREAGVGRSPYWSERQRSKAPGAVSLAGTVRDFIRLADDLDSRGYFEKAFDKDCVDGPADPVRPSWLIEREIGVADLWPLPAERLMADQDLFCDAIEVLHDFVARPRSRRMHGYSGCGWHHSSFSLETGQVLYRWRVNQVLDRSDLGLRLADEGEDAGRLVAATDPARSGLVAAMAKRSDTGTGDLVRHAIALYRGRDASEHHKRSATVTLAGVLEERRSLLKAKLMSKDEGALFQIANQFAIRHRRDDQRPDYDPAFLDWVFWWYLATIELTDRILERQQLRTLEAQAPLAIPAWIEEGREWKVRPPVPSTPPTNPWRS